jgi:hypothetical protein
MSQHVNRSYGLVVAAWLMGMLGNAPAHSMPVCTHLPRFGWVSAEEVEARLEKVGFKLLRLRITNEACYAALVRNGSGQVLELRVHPATSEVMPTDSAETATIRR